MAARLKQDQRTVHLLPAYNPAKAFVSNNPPIGGSPEHNAYSGLKAYGYTPLNQSRSYVNQPYWRRYVGIFVKKDTGVRYAGKIITQLDLDKWAEENGYIILRQHRLYASINPEREKTELI